ncbi:MAG TPA: hypothetical protein VGF97_01300 [Rhizomicrobium sp.]|jgi:uncharacterized protein
MRQLGIGIAAWVFAMAAAAHAASFDCGHAASWREKTVCADPKLSALDEALNRRYADALARSLDPALFRADQEEWLSREQSVHSAQDLALHYQVRLDLFARQLAWPQFDLAKRETGEAEARAHCLAAIADLSDDETCKVTQFGALGTVDQKSFAFALYEDDAKGGVNMAMQAAIFERQAAGRLKVIVAPRNDGGRFETPRLLHTGAGLLLHIPGSEDGTGNFNSERLFLWRAGHWDPVDTISWLTTLQKRLPKGLSAQKGIYPDYGTMTAKTDLWRETDSNACASGGAADIALALSGTRIVLTGLHPHPQKSDC